MIKKVKKITSIIVISCGLSLAVTNEAKAFSFKVILKGLKLFRTIHTVKNGYDFVESLNKEPVENPNNPRITYRGVEPEQSPPSLSTQGTNPELGVTKSSSAQAVKDYYSILNDRKYSTTWGLLSPGFRRKYSENSFSSYKTWWNKVDRIAVGQTEQVSQGENQAIVEVSLTYHLKDGRSIGDHKRFSLVFDNDTNNWLIDDSLRGKSASSYVSSGSSESSNSSSSMAIKDYYSMLNSQKYSTTWGLLSPEFKRRYSKNSFSSYETWWNKVDRIAVGQTKQVSQGENQAIVEVSLTYHLKDGRSIGDQKRFSLIFDNDTNNWLIDDKLGG